MLSPSLEDYLEEVYRLSLHKKEIRIKDVADLLKVSMPSVVKGLKKLDQLGYLEYSPYEKIQLPSKGKKMGKFLVHRNQVLREFIDVIGADCDIKAEAEAMEHYLTNETIRSIEKLVKFLKDEPDIAKKFKAYKVKSFLDDMEID